MRSGIKRADLVRATALRRRDVLAGVGAAAVMAWGGRAAHGQAAPRIGLSESLYEDAATLLNARHGGHFSGGAADADIDLVADSAAVMAGLRNGRFAIGQVLALELMRDAARQGNAAEPLVSVATFARMPLFAYGRRPKGRTVAIPAEIAEADAFLTLDLLRKGSDPKRTTRIAVDRMPDALGLILSRKADAAVLTAGRIALIGSAFERKGSDHKGMGMDRRDLDNMTTPFPGICFAAARSLVDSKPALVADLVRGLLASAREQLVSDRRKPIEERLKAVKAPERSELRTYMLQVAHAIPFMWLVARERDTLLRHDPARWSNAASLVAKAGFGDVTASLGKLYTDRFVEEASRN